MKVLYLNERPNGFPNEDTFEVKETTRPELPKSGVVVQLLYISVDPYMRGRMSNQKSYVAPFEIGEPIVGGAVGKVFESDSSKFKEGDLVTGFMPFAEYAACKPEDLRMIQVHGMDARVALGVLGMPGLTAYFGMNKIAVPKKGETVVVSAAAGAVGSVAGQLALNAGARVIGLVGSDEKAKLITEDLKFTTAINYKADNFAQTLKNACPDGIDVYFENVGGEIADQIWPLLNPFARIPVCGSISSYNLKKGEQDIGPRVQPYLVKSRAMMQGFLVGDFNEFNGEAYKELTSLLKDGKLIYKDSVEEGGIQAIPQAFERLFNGDNIGKQLVKISD
ncbi:NADP-dependent oxidoreductase [Shouchella patagoniensis]|uniref:NADP-dependent oxidoreductase n=1 Tax=Shouchella patagoniensis TaxID=228576 RepID=UPI001FE2480B|nr:NADP-dependent oxidoreductase [Shouchella patagoniensis]